MNTEHEITIENVYEIFSVLEKHNLLTGLNCNLYRKFSKTLNNQEDIINEIVKYNDYVKNSDNKYSDYIMESLLRTMDNDKYDISKDDEINKISSNEVFKTMMETYELLSYSEEIKN